MSIPNTLERIATALESIATALTGQPPATAPQTRPHRPDTTAFEWEPEPDAPAIQPLPEPEPPQERCGFLIEKYVHPLDRSSLIYQVSKSGVSEILTEQEAEPLLALGDEEFTAAMAGRLAKVLAERFRQGGTGGVAVTVLPPEERDGDGLLDDAVAEVLAALGDEDDDGAEGDRIRTTAEADDD